jgi:hypothetical protein
MNLRTLSPLALGLSVLSRSALAGIVSTTGAVEVVSPPADVRLSAFENDSVVRVFAERQGHTLATNLAADITVPGTSPLPADPTNLNLSPGTLPSGTVVDSFYLHFDPPGISDRLEGSLIFDRDVLGLMTLANALTGSHVELGVAGTIYGSGPLEHSHPEFPDFVTLSDDRRTVSFSINAGMGHDSIRIVTSAVPEPGTALLLGLGGAALLAACRRQRRTD